MAKRKPSSSNPSSGIDGVLDDLLEKLGELPGIIGQLGNIVSQLASSLNPLIAAFSKLASLGGSADDTVTESPQDKSTALLTAATERQTVITGRLIATIDRLIAIMTKTAQLALPQAKPVAPGASEEAGGGAAAGIGMLGKLAAVGAVAAAALAVVAVAAGLIEKEFKKLEGFVKLFNPAVITIFQQALDNLGATIGRGFVPLFQDLTEVVRQYAAILAPVISQLAPIVKQLSDIFSNILIGVLTQLGNVLKTLLPTFAQLGTWFQFIAVVAANLFNSFSLILRALLLFGQVLFELSGMGLVLRALTKIIEAINQAFTILDAAFDILEIVINTVMDSLIAMITSIIPVKEIMAALTQAIQFVIRNMYVFAVMLAKLAGLDGVVAALIDSIDKKANAKGDTAAQTPQLKGLEQLAKDLALASATAGGAAGGNGVKNQQEFWAKTLEEMKNAAVNGVSIKDILLRIEAEIKKMLNPFAAGGAAAPPGAGAAGAGLGGIGGGLAGGKAPGWAGAVAGGLAGAGGLGGGGLWGAITGGAGN